jgi:transcriptional regulator with XRE-family HTH domain
MSPTIHPAATPQPTSLSQALTHRIRELLEREGWSQRQFAARLGITQGAVSYLLAEKRRAAVLDYYERLAEVFGVSLSVLVADLEQRVAGSGKKVPELPVPAYFDRTAKLVESTLVRAFIEALLQASSAGSLDAHTEAHARAALQELSAVIHNAPRRPRAKESRRRTVTPPQESPGDHRKAG